MSKITITIKEPTGREKKLTVDKDELIGGVKNRAGYQNFNWKFDTEVLINEKTFGFYEIEVGDTIIASVKVPGGINK